MGPGEGLGWETGRGYSTTSDEVDELLTEAYVSGVSQRKMADVTEGLMGKRVSR